MPNDEAIVYYKPGCNTCKAVMGALKDDHGLALKEINYYEVPFTSDELGRLVRAMGKEPRDILRKDSSLFAELGLDNEEKGNEELLRLMVENPDLIERPIVVYGDKVILARPKEELDELFNPA